MKYMWYEVDTFGGVGVGESLHFTPVVRWPIKCIFFDVHVFLLLTIFAQGVTGYI